MDIKLTSKMILEKEFKKNFKGYNVEEVDSFLDEIIQDYETFEKWWPNYVKKIDN